MDTTKGMLDPQASTCDRILTDYKLTSETDLTATKHVLLCRILKKHKCVKEILRHKVGGYV